MIFTDYYLIELMRVRKCKLVYITELRPHSDLSYNCTLVREEPMSEFPIMHKFRLSTARGG